MTGVQTCALRSEEHTSELQSHDNLVCRLLLEKNSRRWSPAPSPAVAGGSPRPPPPHAPRAPPRPRSARERKRGAVTTPMASSLFFFNWGGRPAGATLVPHTPSPP